MFPSKTIPLLPGLPTAGLRGVRLRAGPLPTAEDWVDAGIDAVLWPVAICAAGRRHKTAPVLDDATAAGLARLWLQGLRCIPLLDHAGPQAAHWSPERPVGPTDVPEHVTGRRPRPLDEDGVRSLVEAYGHAAGLLKRSGVPLAGVLFDDDGFFHASLSPLTAAGSLDERSRWSRSICQAVGAKLPVVASLCVEELAPGGLDATDGIVVARLLEQAGACGLVASGGSNALPPLKERKKGANVMGEPLVPPWIHSAAWLAGRVSIPVWACGPSRSLEAATDAAVAHGLQGAFAIDSTMGAEEGA